MRKILCLLLALLTVTALAQTNRAKVTLKTGVTIVGTIEEIDATSHVVIRVSGVNTKIEMNDISSIEDIHLSNTVKEESVDFKLGSVDNSNYPESYTLKVGPYDLEMILVRGATFNMGYDGRGSLKKCSEPVHPVQLSSYYVNKSPLSKQIVSYLKKGTESKSTSYVKYKTGSVYDAVDIVSQLADLLKLPINLITEAQCEYIMSSDNISNFSLFPPENIWCRDFFSEYAKSIKPVVDPVVGPSAGKKLVIRVFTAKGDDIYNRYTSVNTNSFSIRVSIPAVDLVSR